MPGRASDAEALWYDPVRWATWVDGFGHVVELSPEWPAAGLRIWDGRPGQGERGRGRVLERVTAYEPRTGQTLAVEDAHLRGIQRVSFLPASDHVAVRLELEYALKERHALTWALERGHVRRRQASSLRRTLFRFARERRGDAELGAMTSR